MLAAIVLATVAAYSVSLRAPFYLDDHRNIDQNPLIRDLGWFARPWTVDASGAPDFHRHAFKTRYLSFLTFALNYRIGGLDVVGYHLVNLALHLLTALGVAACARRMLLLPAFAASRLRPDADTVSALVAALFALHPIQTQAVTYIVQRMAVLAAALCVLSFWAYLRALAASTRRGAAGWSALALLALAAAMFAKQNAVVFPVVMLLFDSLFVARSRRQRVTAWVAAGAAALVVPARQLYLVAVSSGTENLLSRATAIGDGVSRLDYLWTQLRVVVAYLRLLLVPVGLNLDHDVAVSRSPLEPAVLASGLLLVTLAAGALWLAIQRRLDPAWRLAGFGGLWFFVALSVESSLLPLPDLMFEHRLYLPSVGFFLAAVVALTVRGGDDSRRTRFTALAGVAVLLGGATFARNRVWADERAFWYDALRKSPEKVRVVYNVGVLEMRDRRFDRAEALFSRAVELDPRHASALVWLGHLARMQGNDELAAAWYRRALDADPSNWRLALDLRVVLLRRGEADEAGRLWQRAVAGAGSAAAAAAVLRETGAGWAVPGAAPAATP